MREECRGVLVVVVVVVVVACGPPIGIVDRRHRPRRSPLPPAARPPAARHRAALKERPCAAPGVFTPSPKAPPGLDTASPDVPSAPRPNLTGQEDKKNVGGRMSVAVFKLQHDSCVCQSFLHNNDIIRNNN